MNEYLEAFLITFVILTYPIPFLIIIRLIIGWNEITYVKDIFYDQYYVIDPYRNLGPTAFAPGVSHIILVTEIVHFILTCIIYVFEKPARLFLKSCEMIGNIRLK